MLHGYSCKEKKRKERRKERMNEEKEGWKYKRKFYILLVVRKKDCRVLRKQYYINAQCAIVSVMSTEGISFQMKPF